MWRKSLIAGILVGSLTLSGLASAQVAVQRQLGSTSKLVVKLVSGQIVEVNKAGGTFKLAVGKQAYVFTFSKLGHAPRFGDEVSVTYAEGSGSPLDALKLQSVD